MGRESLPRALCGVLAALGVTCGSDCLAEDTAASQAATSAARSRPLYPTPGAQYVAFDLPGPIRAAECERYSHMLNLNEAQVTAMQYLFQDYLEQYLMCQDHEAPMLWELSERIATSGSLYASMETASQNETLFNGRNRVCRILRGIDSAFFAEVESILADFQLPAMTRVRQARSRIRSLQASIEYPGARIDLTLLVDQMRAEHPLRTLDDAAFEQSLVAYEGQYTRLLEEHQEARIETLKAVPLIYASIARPSPDASPQELQQWRVANEPRSTEARQIRAKVDALKKKLHDLNRQSVRQMAALLQDEDGDDLVRRFNAAAYGAVYPNPFDCDELCQSLLAEGTLDLEQRAAVSSLCDSLRERQESVSEKMVKRLLAWTDEFHLTHSLNQVQFEQYKADMTNLQEQRKEIARSGVAEFRSIVGPSEEAQTAKGIEIVEAAIEAHVPETAGIDFTP